MVVYGAPIRGHGRNIKIIFFFKCYCIPSRTSTFSPKSIGFPQETLLFCKSIAFAFSQKYCVPLRNFVVACSRSRTVLTWEQLSTWMTDSWAGSCSLTVEMVELLFIVFRTMSRVKSIQGPLIMLLLTTRYATHLYMISIHTLDPLFAHLATEDLVCNRQRRLLKLI